MNILELTNTHRNYMQSILYFGYLCQSQTEPFILIQNYKPPDGITAHRRMRGLQWSWRTLGGSPWCGVLIVVDAPQMTKFLVSWWNETLKAQHKGYTVYHVKTIEEAHELANSIRGFRGR